MQRLMRQMGIAALGPKPRTTKPAPGHKIFPSLAQPGDRAAEPRMGGGYHLRLPIGRGFLYMVAIIDWASCVVLAWRLSNTMDVGSRSRRWRRRSPGSASRRSSTATRAATHQRGLHRHAGGGRHPHLDGRRCWIDNVFIERLWRSLKYEDTTSKATPTAARPEPGSANGWLFITPPASAPGAGKPDAERRSGATGAGGALEEAVDMTLRLTTRRVAHIPTAAATAKPQLDDFRRSERRRFQLTARH